MSERDETEDVLAALVDQAFCVADVGRAAGLERVRHDLDAIAAYLTEALLPADLRAAGIRFEWAEG